GAERFIRANRDTPAGRREQAIAFPEGSDDARNTLRRGERLDWEGPLVAKGRGSPVSLRIVVLAAKECGDDGEIDQAAELSIDGAGRCDLGKLAAEARREQLAGFVRLGTRSRE